MFSAIAFVPTFLRRSSGLTAAGSGLLMLLGVAIFGAIFTNRLAENLARLLGSHPQRAIRAGITSAESLVPATVQAAGEPLRSAIVDGYADALAPVFWYLLPIMAVAFGLALLQREVPLSIVAGMVARGEAVAPDCSFRSSRNRSDVSPHVDTRRRSRPGCIDADLSVLGCVRARHASHSHICAVRDTMCA